MTERQTALVVVVPEAERLVGPYRQHHDPSGAWGMPAHVTLLTPFRDPRSVDDALLAELGALFAETPSFTCRFEATGRFPGTLYLAPEPAGLFRGMTERLVARYPGTAPYGGIHRQIVPHLTVLYDCADCLATHVASRLREGLPLESEVQRVHLYVGANAEPGWKSVAVFPLGEAAP